MSRFTTDGRFSMNIYRNFFNNASDFAIRSFFVESQQIIEGVSYYIMSDNKNRHMLQNLLNMMILLLSGMNTRSYHSSYENSISGSVSINNMDIKKEIDSYLYVKDKFVRSVNPYVVIPCDICGGYDIADYLILFYEIDKRRFDLPHFFELKTIKDVSKIYSFQERLTKQKIRMAKSLKKYNTTMDLDHDFLLNLENILIKYEDKIIKLISNESDQELKIDEIYSITHIKNWNRKGYDKNYVYYPVGYDHKMIGLLPQYFRGVSSKIDISAILLKVDIQKFKTFLHSFDNVRKVEKDNNPMNSWVYLNPKYKENRRFTVMYLIGLTLTKSGLEHFIKYVDLYMRYPNLGYNPDQFLNHSGKTILDYYNLGAFFSELV